MKKLLLLILSIITVLMIVNTGCSDVNNASPSNLSDGIKSVVPAQAPYGARVLIGGKGFGNVQQVLFNGTQASLEAVSDTSILTRVPMNATSGPIEVISGENTFKGPSFTVDSTGNLFLTIDKVRPTQGRFRDTVRISGTGFNSTGTGSESLSKNVSSPNDNLEFSSEKIKPGVVPFVEETNSASGVRVASVVAEPQVYFNGIQAPVTNFSDTLIVATVPQDATTGLVTVISEPDTAIGPEFTILNHAIAEISPESGTVGTEVIITGSDFSENTADNVVAFNGVEAPVHEASATQLVTAVPEGATSGAVTVTINNSTVTGPDFNVSTTGSLIVNISTSGSDLDPDGYLLSVDEAEGVRVKPNDSFTETGLAAGSHGVSISDIEANCFIIEELPNPRTVEIAAGETTTIEYNISCEGANEPPVAIFTSECSNLTCDFDASGSSDSDGAIESYAWEFGDGIQGSGQIISHDYENSGTYTVQLTVTDNEGAVDIVSEEITVTQPVITGITPESGPAGTEVTISGSHFSATASENIVTFNGVRAELNSASETEILAIVPGDATTGPVNVTVDGQTAEGPTFTVEVVGTLEVTTSTSGSSLDADGYLLNVQGFSEQTVQVNETVSYENIVVGNYQVELGDIAPNCFLSEEIPNPRTVEVTEGATTSTVFSVFCNEPNEPPTASFTSECTNLSCLFDAAGSTDSDGSIVSYEWTFGDGLNGTGESVNKNYEVPGTYVVELTVTDDDGATGVVSEEITVTLPEIDSISPSSGPVGTLVAINGSGFSNTISENTVTFDGAEAGIETASETELVVIVPETATTGPVRVTVDGYTVTGPTFTVEQPKTLDVGIETAGSQIDPDGYTLSVTGKDDLSVNPNETVQFTDIYADEVEVALSGVASNCRIEGDNPRTVSLNNTDNAGSTSFVIDCTIDLRGEIIFTTDRDGNSEIYKQNEEASTIKRITNTPGIDENSPAVSPDGLKIVYSSNNQIFIMDSDGSDVTQITKDGYNTSPSWSPKGDKIVFERFVTSEIPDIYTMNIDGSDLRNITNTETIAERQPDWSPDGVLIVFVSYENENPEIFTIRTDGSGRTQLTTGSNGDFEPEWSPEGKRIAFVRNIIDGGSKVHIMNSDGSNINELTPGTSDEQSPSWSPDGSMMAYSTILEGVYHIYVYDVELNNIISSPFTPSNDQAPHWNYR